MGESSHMDLLEQFQKNYSKEQVTHMSIQEYLELCKQDAMVYAHAAERILAAIGEPEILDTSKQDRLGRIMMNRTIKVYPAFRDFYGMEETIERVVGYFVHAAQGLEEKKQILYLLGPTGAAKSSIAERLKSLMEKQPIYVLQVGSHVSPVFESPLGIFDLERMAPQVSAAYDIPLRYFTGLPSPWAVKRLQELNGDLSQVRVAKMWPSKLKQIAIAKTEPGDENNQDISCLVGKVDIRQLEHYSQSDPDAYSYSGALCRGNQGITEMVEIWKAPIKVLHPLLTATQEQNYTGTEAIGGIPFQGVVFAHSNESEWQTFRNNKSNEAFLDRICVIKVPYCLRTDEEQQIYQKLLQHSSLSQAVCAPKTLEVLSQFCVLTRLKPHENSNAWSKMRVYNGENIRDTDPRAKSIVEYKDAAGQDEGMSGISTRFAFKVLSETFNYDNTEVAADPVHLMYVLEQRIRREQFPEEQEKTYLEFIKEWIAPKYIQFLEKELQKTYLESYDEYGQNIYDRYVTYADAWISDSDYRDPDTGQLLNRDSLNKELEKIEKPANIANPKDFRGEFVNYVLRARGRPENAGSNPRWTEYQKFREVIEKKIFSSTEELLPIISFGSKKNSEDLEKHAGFVNRMMAQGYTQAQCRRLVEYYIRQSKSH
jgi:serine protein kinase